MAISKTKNITPKNTSAKKSSSPSGRAKTSTTPSASSAAVTTTSQLTLQGEPVHIRNEGQKVIYLIRKAYLEGELANESQAETQFILNTPTTIDQSRYQPDPRDQAFLQEIIQKITAGQIALFTPSTLLNTKVYNRLSAAKKAKADYDILILLHKIRQVKKLWDEGARDSYQIMNLVHSLRLAKESLETRQGDVFVI